jgi:hypothetical protein
MQAIITSAAIGGGAVWAYTENHYAISRFTLGLVSHALRAVGLL